MIKVFDLDGTVIDSRHRYKTVTGGGIDLPYWIEHNTAENCHLDTILPCAATMRKAYRDGHTILVCTARVLNDHDYVFFMENDLLYTHILSRPEGCIMADSELKEIQLRLWAQSEGMTWAQFCNTAIMYDDADSIISKMMEIGVDCIDAKKQNRLLKWAAA